MNSFVPAFNNACNMKALFSMYLDDNIEEVKALLVGALDEVYCNVTDMREPFDYDYDDEEIEMEDSEYDGISTDEIFLLNSLKRRTPVEVEKNDIPSNDDDYLLQRRLRLKQSLNCFEHDEMTDAYLASERERRAKAPTASSSLPKIPVLTEKRGRKVEMKSEVPSVTIAKGLPPLLDKSKKSRRSINSRPLKKSIPPTKVCESAPLYKGQSERRDTRFPLEMTKRRKKSDSTLKIYRDMKRRMKDIPDSSKHDELLKTPIIRPPDKRISFQRVKLISDAVKLEEIRGNKHADAPGYVSAAFPIAIDLLTRYPDIIGCIKDTNFRKYLLAIKRELPSFNG